ncbi:sulfatase-like hydrolase/transferase [Algoriphagus persicinus]|uniref:sulfatase-like hydrolase/transferase n=1 Tax=Algoriphagus persicinus TaxID=3108754 RepID=UPI002B37F615|nr:sulfatase-like hydrolase/transferase [Algoriphagus sp. E1-3-M2]MEB2786612.1 sulfatase-like hydrolase/transferase [Algoriphagus sp. E1-3-M2]
MGATLQKLEEGRLLGDTFVFYFGDHGRVFPGSKGYLYETGLHVPLVVRIPENFTHLVNNKKGDVNPGFVSFIDFMPTVLNQVGIAVPDQMDGIPFLP